MTKERSVPPVLPFINFTATTSSSTATTDRAHTCSCRAAAWSGIVVAMLPPCSTSLRRCSSSFSSFSSCTLHGSMRRVRQMEGALENGRQPLAAKLVHFCVCVGVWGWGGRVWFHAYMARDHTDPPPRPHLPTHMHVQVRASEQQAPQFFPLCTSSNVILRTWMLHRFTAYAQGAGSTHLASRSA